MDAIQFTRRLDAARLRDDLAAATAAAAWVEKPGRGRYHQWSALTLHGLRGDPGTADMHVMPSHPEDCGPTPLARACPYVCELLESFAAAKLRVRFMRLAAGGHIGRHRDRQYGWELPVLRLHAPVVTSADVEFLLAGRRIDMRPGELWYVDTTQEHEVMNHGAIDRVHLVIDLVNGPALREQLGPTTWATALPAAADLLPR